MDDKRKGTLKWDSPAIAKVFKINETDVREYFTDGRRVSFIIERRIAREVIKGKLAPSEGAGFDVIDPQGGKWEVRSISKGGIYFCPSYMVGSGRKFDEDGFLAKLKTLKGYVVTDIDAFPDMPFWIVPSSQVLKWWKDGKLGTITKISHKEALSLLKQHKTS